MRRVFANLAVTLAMLVCAITATGLICSFIGQYSVSTGTFQSPKLRIYSISSYRGGLLVRFVADDAHSGRSPLDGSGMNVSWHLIPGSGPGAQWPGSDAWQFRFLGVRYGRTEASEGQQQANNGMRMSWRIVPDYRLAVPYWFIGAVAVSLLILSVRYRRRAMKIAGHCDHCGYDLRATPDRCPECGAVPGGVKGFGYDGIGRRACGEIRVSDT